MKIGLQNNFNALVPILEVFPSKKPVILTHALIDKVISALYLSNILCESKEEAVDCLEILKDMGMLEINIARDAKGNATTLSIGNLYNGK